MRASITRRALGAAAAATFAAAASRALAAPTLELVMVERAGCAWCARWNAEIAPLYGKTAEGAQAPLRRHDLAAGQPPGAREPVRFTPTFVLLREGKEVGRVTGYVDEGMFWGLLGQLLEKAKQG
jgi:thioredoxin-related protein